MAFANFSVSTVYTTLITMLNTQLTALGNSFRDQTTGDYTNQIRYSSANKCYEYWSGSAWAALDVSSTTITSATNATNATTAANATTHIASAVGTEHGATSAATANMIARRDAAGKLAGDILGNAATATNATSHIAAATGAEHGAVSTATANMIARRDATGKLTGDITGNAASATNATSHIASATGAEHGAVATATANMIARRDAAGKLAGDILGNAATSTSSTTATNASGTGSIPLARYENGLRIIRGVVSSTGSIVSGSGFASSKSSTGNYTITPTNAFAAGYVTIVASPSVDAGFISASAVSASIASVQTYNTAVVATDKQFSFILIGPN